MWQLAIVAGCAPVGVEEPNAMGNETDDWRTYATALVERHTGNTSVVFLEHAGAVRPHIRKEGVDYPLSDGTWEAIQQSSHAAAVVTPTAALERPDDAWCAVTLAVLEDQGRTISTDHGADGSCILRQLARVVEKPGGPDEIALSEVGEEFALGDTLGFQVFPGDDAFAISLRALIDSPSQPGPTEYLALRLKNGAGWRDWWSYPRAAQTYAAVYDSAVPHRGSKGTAGVFAERHQRVNSADYFITNSGFGKLFEHWDWLQEPGRVETLLGHYRAFDLDAKASAIAMEHEARSTGAGEPEPGQGSPSALYYSTSISDDLLAHWKLHPPPFEPVRLPPAIRATPPTPATPAMLSVWIADQDGYAPVNERGFVDYISLPPRLYGSLAELLRHPTLQRVERITIDGANGEAPLASLATLPLTTLHLKNVTIPSGPNSIPTLQRLDLTECVAEDDVLAAFLIAATGLQNLYLPGTKVGPRTLEAILTLPHLDSVRIDGLSEHDAMRVRKRIPTAVLE